MECYWDTVWQFGEEWPVEVCAGKETIEVRVNTWLFAPGGVPAGFVSNVGSTYADVGYLHDPGQNYGVWTAVAEHLARERWFQSICFAPEVNPPFGVPRCQQFSVTFDEDLGTTQDDVQVEAPDPPCIDPGYTMPDSTVIPSFEPVPEAEDHDQNYVFGLTANWVDVTLSCQQVCINNETQYRITGDMVLGLAIEISQQLPDFQMCTSTGRTSTRIGETEDHEEVHAQAYINRINSVRTAWLGSLYGTAGSCASAAASALTNMNNEMDQEADRQWQHFDHHGEPRYALDCPVAGGNTVEYQCGVGDPNCPDGHTY